MNIYWVFADFPEERNTSWWRCLMPKQYMVDAGHTVHATHNTNALQDAPSSSERTALSAADTVIYERTIVPEVLPWLRKVKKMGKQLVITFDDAYHLMPKTASSNFWRGKEGRKNLAAFRVGLGIADKVFVTTQLLADEFRKFAQQMFVVPNYTHKMMWKDAKPRPKDPFIVIGWGGSSAHTESWKFSGIIGVLSEIQRRYPQTQLRMHGGDIGMQAILDASGVTYIMKPWVSFTEWPNVLSKVDIGLMPLHGRYDTFRSNIKAQEYGMAQIPWVATDGPVYKDCPAGILIPNNNRKLWIKALSKLIESKSLRQRYGSIGRTWVQQVMNEAVQVYEAALQQSP